MPTSNRHPSKYAVASALLVSAALFFVGCRQAAPLASDHSADEAKLRQLDSDWVKAAATHSADAWDAFYAHDAVVLPPNEPTASGQASIHKSIAAFLATPQLVVTWMPAQVVVSDAGDMAYLYGTYKLSAIDEKRSAITDAGKIVEIWRKRNGEWKCVVDTWNSDAPLPAT